MLETLQKTSDLPLFYPPRPHPPVKTIQNIRENKALYRRISKNNLTINFEAEVFYVKSQDLFTFYHHDKTV